MAQAPFFSESVVWGYYEDNLWPYHLQSITVARDGTLLAFSEGRIDPDDAGAHHIVLKRSTNNGQTWGNNQYVVLSSNGESFANPTVVIDRNSNPEKIFLFYAQNFTNSSSRVFYRTSTNSGATWSGPTEVTQLFDGDPLDRPFHLPGPGHGIQLSNGRMMVQVWHRFAISADYQSPPVAERKYGISTIYSDNGGATWLSGGYTQDNGFLPNESRIVQRADGSIVLNARDAQGGKKRIISTSTNSGASWSAPVFDNSLSPHFATDAGMRRFTLSTNNNFNRILFSRPVDPNSRSNLMVSLSYSETANWSFARTIYGGKSFYSDLAVSNDKSRIFVLYGKDGSNAFFSDTTAMASFNLEWLTGGRDFLTRTGSTTFVSPYQAEDLHISDSSADTTGTFDEAAASGGRVLRYLSNAVNDYITLIVHVPQTGNYNVAVRSRTASNRGIIQLNVNGVNRGSTFNPYSANVGYASYKIGTVPLNAGVNSFKFVVTGKSAASSGFSMFPDSITLTPQ